MKTSYVHCARVGRSLLGFSAKILAFDKARGGELGKDARSLCQIAFTFCNAKDKQFSKKIARVELEEKPLLEVRCVDVPYMLAAAELYVYGAQAETVPTRFDVSRYNYVLKRFL